MADIDLKTETPDASINDSAILFGADSQASANPSVYSVATVRSHFVGAGTLNVASGKTLTASNTLTLAGTDGTTMTFPTTSATLARTDAGNTFTGNQTVSGGTITANAPVLNLSQTWDASGVTFTGLQFNAAGSSDANSASGSQLLALQVGGVNRYWVTKDSSWNWFPSAGTSTYAWTNSVFYSTLTIRGVPLVGFNVAGGAVGVGLTLKTDSAYAWGSNINSTGDLLLTRRGAANLRLGAADAAAPVAQTLSVQSVVAGTSNTAGANLTITGSQGTGTGAGGSIIFQVAPAGSSGTAQNALATALTIGADRKVTISGSATGIIFDNSVSGRLICSAASAPSQGMMTLGFGPGFNGVGSTSYAFSTNPGVVSADLVLERDAANTLALRNSTNAQEFRVYNTFTSSTNFERFRIFAQSGAAVLIGTEKGSAGGTARALELQTDGTTRLTLTTLGSVVVNTAAVATTATDGFLYVPTCAGTPTGTPTTQTGTAPIVVDTTNNKLYFYSGGVWRDAGP